MGKGGESGGGQRNDSMVGSLHHTQRAMKRIPRRWIDHHQDHQCYNDPNLRPTVLTPYLDQHGLHLPSRLSLQYQYTTFRLQSRKRTRTNQQRNQTSHKVLLHFAHSIHIPQIQILSSQTWMHQKVIGHKTEAARWDHTAPTREIPAKQLAQTQDE